VRAAAGTGLDPIANVLYYHRDYQGSVVGTSLRSGGVDGVTGAGYRYTPYGQLDRATNVTAASDSELGYTNGLRLLWKAGTAPALPQTPGLVLLGARVYHAELKRWLQPDTVDALRYTYTGGDPVNFIDPSGRMAIDGHSNQPGSGGYISSPAYDPWSIPYVSSRGEVSATDAQGYKIDAPPPEWSVAIIDAAWVALGGFSSENRIATIASWYAYYDKGAPDGYARTIDKSEGTTNSRAVGFTANPNTSNLPNVLAFRGTELTSLKNWETNLENGVGLSTGAHQWAVRTGRDWYAENPGGLFVGHSLGGGLAAAASMSNLDSRFIAINAASVSDLTQWRNRAGPDDPDKRGKNIFIVGEVLTYSQPVRALGMPIPVEPSGGGYGGTLSLRQRVDLHSLEVAAPMIMRKLP
jgi:RHS repeat-associated protein